MVELAPAPFKLIKETLPPGFKSAEAHWEENKLRFSTAQRDARYLDFLFNNATGLYGNRPGNRWRLSARKWIEHFITIQDKQTGAMVPFKLNEAQRALEAKVLRSERRGEPVRKWVLKARQQGISTYVAARLLEFEIRNPNSRGMLMGHLRNSASVLQGRMGGMIRDLRRKDGSHWKIELDADNREEVTLGAPLRSTTLIWTAEGADYRGDTLRFFHAIEPGEWPPAKAKAKANAVWKSVPKAAGTYVFVEGTAKGDTGWFAENWKAAWKRKRDGADVLYEWAEACFFPWFIHDRYRWSVVTGKPLADNVGAEIKATLSEEEAKLLRTRYFRRGHGWTTVDLDQLAWRRMAIVQECSGMVEDFHQEYPSTPEEAFLSTGLKFFSAVTIADFRERFASQAPVWRGDTIDPEGERKMMRTLEELEAHA